MLSADFNSYIEMGFSAEDALLMVCPCTSISICGNYEKHTCMKLLETMYQMEGKRVYLYDEIRLKQISTDLDQMKTDDIVILKLSLEALKLGLHKNAHISIITNMIPYPIERGMTYYDLINIFARSYIKQTSADYIVLSRDYHFLQSVLPEMKGHLIGFAPRQHIERGIGVKSEKMCVFEEDDIVELVDMKLLKLPGIRKLDGYMAVVAAASMTLSYDTIRKGLINFNGAENHYKLVATKNNVRFFNNANSYMPSHTVQSFQPFEDKVVLITGGPTSNLSYSSLAMEIIAFVKVLILYGESADIIEKETQKAPFYNSKEIKIIRIESITEAVQKAYEYAVPKDVVIYSPSGGYEKNRDAIIRNGKEFTEAVMNL